MNTSGEAAEQVMRMSLEGAEILIKLTGSGAKNAAVLLYSIYKEQNKTRGKERLTNMLRSGKPLKVYTFKRDNLEKFKEVAKEYGILYTVLKEKEDKDGVDGAGGGVRRVFCAISRDGCTKKRGVRKSGSVF